ncbi:MAG: membrane protein insertase YidC [Immundisolibacterales bacterium]|nr:membrane protein insertase YidC [Immundisolibacterales bacterium]
MPVEQLRPILLIGLAVVGFLLWQEWQEWQAAMREPAPAAREAPRGRDVPDAGRTANRTGSGAQTGTTAARPEAADVPAAADVPSSSGQPASVATPAHEGELVAVRTDVLDVLIDPRGGTIRQVLLSHYPVTVEEPDRPFVLMDDRPGLVYVAESGLVGASAPTHHDVLTADRSEFVLAPGTDRLDVRFHWEDGNGVRIDKVYEFGRDSYEIGVRYEIVNGSPQPWTGQIYGHFRRVPPTESGGFGDVTSYTYTGAVLSSPDKPYEKIDFDDMQSENLDREVADGWLAMIQHYFASAWIPEPSVAARYYTKALERGEYLAGLIGPPVTVGAGTTGETRLKLYAGPKVQDRLEAAAPGLKRTVDYGWLFFIAQPLYVALWFIHEYVGNWGWSIILLTFAIKLAFYHLSAASYRSMARMRKLAPRIQTLRERHGGDRQKMNQAMMELYKKEKINPLGGCLPIVVQIPVFIALYWVLLETVELRHAEFIFWLNDLASKDPYFVLPILMGGSMFLQQRLSPTPPDPIQAKVMMFLPIIFTGLFLTFPSGLVLYWLVNNVLSIAQQWAITKRIEGGKET